VTDRSLPVSVAAVYAAVAAGRPEEAAPSFAEDTVYAYGADPVDEQARRTIVGRGEIASDLAVDLTAWGTPEILASVTAGPDCFVEGRLVDAAREVVAAIAAVFQLDADGAISRAVSYRTPPLEPSPSWSEHREVDVDARGLLERYFRGLQDGDFEAAASYFTDDVVYLHPPYDPGDAERPELRGRDGLVAGFTKRGLRPYRQRILACVRSGTECFVEGDVEGTRSPDGVAFVSSMSFAADGRIRRYAAFSAPPVVPRR
jgi:ketosteroid isomerase-like protein